MKVMNSLMTRYFYSYVFLTGCFSLATILRGDPYCRDLTTGKTKCCSDYRNVSGICKPCLGSFGMECGRSCPDGFYGHGCKGKCNCSASESCDKVYGCSACIGWFGENCSHPCSFGFFGFNCLEKCNCSSDTHWCDNIYGCKIKPSGMHTTLVERNEDESYHALKVFFSFATILKGDPYCIDPYRTYVVCDRTTGGVYSSRTLSFEDQDPIVSCLGSFGVDCIGICPDGYYGHGCRGKCDCLPTESCHKVHGCTDSACIGSLGENCSNPCTFGFFGFNCLEKCNCSSDTHWCDNIHGCTFKGSDTLGVHYRTMGNKIKHIAFAAVGSFIGTSAFWFLLYLVCRWKRRSNNTMGVTIQEEGDSGNSLDESQQQLGVHVAAVQSGTHGRSKSFQHRSKKTNGDSRRTLSRSRSLTHDTYDRLNRRSDDYNYLDFLGRHNSTSAFCSNYSKVNISNYNKRKLKTSHGQDSTDSETCLGERSNISKNTSHSLHDSEDEMAELHPHQLCKYRPYSSVKYNRKLKNPEEAVIDELTSNTTAECQARPDVRIFIQDENASDFVGEFDQVYGFHRKHIQMI